MNEPGYLYLMEIRVTPHPKAYLFGCVPIYLLIESYWKLDLRHNATVLSFCKKIIIILSD